MATKMVTKSKTNVKQFYTILSYLYNWCLSGMQHNESIWCHLVALGLLSKFNITSKRVVVWHILCIYLFIIIIRAVAGQRSSPDLCFVTKSIKSTTKDIDLIVTQVGCDGTA